MSDSSLSRFTLHRFEREFEVIEVAAEEARPPVVDEPMRERIDSLWRQALAQRDGALFDGPLFSIEAWREGQLRGRFVPYRWWVAQCGDPALRSVLNVRPASVCGLTVVDGGVVFGLRSPDVYQDPGSWEPVPAGGIEDSARDERGRLSPRSQILAEFAEELHVEADCVSEVLPRGLVVDAETQVHDIVYELCVDIGWPAVCDRFASRKSREYQEVRRVPFDELPEFLERERNVSPIAKVVVAAKPA